MSAERLLEDSYRPDVENLRKSLEDRDHPITWRTAILNMRTILGSKTPENEIPPVSYEVAREFVENVTQGSYWELLTPEILYDIGFKEVPKDITPLDALLISGRHEAEPILWGMADELKARGKRVAVMIPDGHYSDRQLRVLGLGKLLHEVEQAYIVASTQVEFGGSPSSVVETMELLNNPEFAPKIRDVNVLMPMFGGSRGHKPGQEFGYEVLQAETVPERMASVAETIILKHETAGRSAPNIRFSSVDIHNPIMPGEHFKTMHGNSFEFTSVGPEACLAKAVIDEIKYRNSHLSHLPIQVDAVDKGAWARSRALCEQMLRQNFPRCGYVDLVLMDKKREGGEVRGTQLVGVKRLWLVEGEIVEEEIDISDPQMLGEYAKTRHIRVVSDDMLDAGNSAKKNDEALDRYFPETAFKLYAVSHAVTSNGVKAACENTGADVVFFGNTLKNEDPNMRNPNVRVVDLSPAVVDAFF